MIAIKFNAEAFAGGLILGQCQIHGLRGIALQQIIETRLGLVLLFEKTRIRRVGDLRHAEYAEHLHRSGEHRYRRGHAAP